MTMGLMDKLMAGSMQQFYAKLTENQLAELEAQGHDVTEYREKLAERRAQEAAEAAKWQNPTHLERLAPLVAKPRDTSSDAFKKLAGKAPLLFGKGGWRKKHSEGDIVYGGVFYSEDDEAWRGGKHKEDGHYVLMVMAQDEAHMRDREWLMRVCSQLRAIVEDRIPVPADCDTIVQMSKDESDWNQRKLPASVSEGVDAVVRKGVLEDKMLPNGYLPTDGIVPHLVWEGTFKSLDAELWK